MKSIKIEKCLKMNDETEIKYQIKIYDMLISSSENNEYECSKWKNARQIWINRLSDKK
jgi:hypothetical protein